MMRDMMMKPKTAIAEGMVLSSERLSSALPPPVLIHL